MSTADDNEKTVTGPGASAGNDPATGLQAERRRGRASAALQPGHTLPIGTRLRDYEITGLIGEGGFGIVYLAWDHSLQRKVAVKEYMPASMAARVNGSSAIVVKSERHLDTFKAGLKSFVNEARLLARFDHLSLVKVYRFWEENGTAYMVMPYYEGPTLKEALAQLGHVPSEDELRAWLKPLLDALSVMHAAQCYHRDIAPDNILLTPRGPLLLDFGAARRVIGDMTHAITVVLKPGYAPIEQYGDVASMTQGAWTDLYALACVVYYAITGKTPMSSVERLMDDRLEPLSVTAAGRYSPAFLRAVDAALAVRPGDRPQNEREFRALLDADRPAAPDFARSLSGREDSGWQERPFATVPGTLTPELATQLQPRPAPDEPATTPVPRAVPIEATLPMAALTTAPAPQEPARAAAPEPLAPAAVARPPAPSPLVERAPAPTPTAAAAPSAIAKRKSGGAGWALAIGAIVVLSALAWWLQRAPTETPLRTPANAASAVGVATPASAASAASVSIPTPAPSAPASVASAPAPAPLAASSAELAPVPAFDPSSAPAAEATRPFPPAPIEPAVRDAEPAVREAGRPVPTASAAAARPRRETVAPRNEPALAKTPAPRAAGSRCSDILQKASLEALTADEAAYLKRECR